jgi:hypothetical protein
MTLGKLDRYLKKHHLTLSVSARGKVWTATLEGREATVCADASSLKGAVDKVIKNHGTSL